MFIICQNLMQINNLAHYMNLNELSVNLRQKNEICILIKYLLK